MSHALEFELNRRWELWITASTDDECQLIVDSDQELTFQLMILGSDPGITIRRCARYYGTRAAGSWRDQPALAGHR